MYELFLDDIILDAQSEKPVYRVLSKKLVDGKIELFSFRSSKKQFIDFSEIYDGIAENNFQIKRLKEENLNVPNVLKNDFSVKERYSDDELMKISLYQNILIKVKELMKSNGLSANKAIEMVIEEHRKLNKEAVYSLAKSTIYRIKKNADRGLPVLSGNLAKGNRNRKKPEYVESLVSKFINDYFIQPNSNYSLRTAINAINHELHKIYNGEQKISDKYFKSVLRGISPNYELLRLNPNERPNSGSIGTMRINVTSPLERIEMDTLHLPFYAQTEHGVVTDINIVLAIDCYLSSIVGWCIVLGKSNSTHTLKCIEMCMYPEVRQAALKRLGITADNQIYGAPRQLVWDNGPEFKTERLSKLPGIGLPTTSTESNAGSKKPFIERFNRSLKEGIEALPGTTRFNGVDGVRDPIECGDHLPSVEELEGWVVRFMFEKYPTQPLKRFTRTEEGLFYNSKDHVSYTPHERCKQIVEGKIFCLPFPVPREKWRSIEYESEVKTLSRTTGISHQGFHYKGEELASLVRRVGDKAKVTVRINPDDFRYVWVILADNESFRLSEEFLTPATPAFSFNQAKKEKPKLKAYATPESARFNDDYYEVAANPKRSAKPAKKGSRAQSKSAIQKAKEDAAIEKLAQPVPSAPGVSENLKPVDYKSDRRAGRTFAPVKITIKETAK